MFKYFLNSFNSNYGFNSYVPFFYSSKARIPLITSQIPIKTPR